MVRASISQPYGREFDFHHPHIWGALYEYTSPLTSKLPNQKKNISMIGICIPYLSVIKVDDIFLQLLALMIFYGPLLRNIYKVIPLL